MATNHDHQGKLLRKLGGGILTLLGGKADGIEYPQLGNAGGKPRHEVCQMLWFLRGLGYQANLG